MRRRFKLRNERQQHLALVIYFFEEQINHNVGIIFTTDLRQKETMLYQNEIVDEVISDLAERLGIDYSDYIEE